MFFLVFLIVFQVQEEAFSYDMRDIFPIKYDIIRARNENQLKAFEASNQYAVLDFIGLVERHGYAAEEHKVTTRDGYNLALHRITGKSAQQERQKQKSKPVVFLQHGALLSSDSFVLIGPGKDLAFLLVDAGYDVWLGNARGNTYCRSHVTLSPKDKQFWEFSYHEVGSMDLRASIDYVLFKARKNVLTFIGYSMAAPEILVLLSNIPEYNKKINVLVLLAPVVIWKHKLPIHMKFYNAHRRIIDDFVTKHDFDEWLPQSSFAGKTSRALCGNKVKDKKAQACSLLISPIADVKTLNTSAYPTIFAHFPAGTSYQSIAHYWQNIDTGEFHAYDYGNSKNLKLYSSTSPPRYDLSRVTVPVAIFYGNKDYFATPADQKVLRRRLPNVILFQKIPYEDFNHLDILWSVHAKQLLYDDVILMANKYRPSSEVSEVTTFVETDDKLEAKLIV